MSDKPPHHTRGFTLIELLIVVSIIAVLAIIAVPNFLMAQRRANQARCATNLKAIAVALQTYKVDLNKYPLADGIAGEDESMGQTLIGNGPAANGSWDGVPRALTTLTAIPATSGSAAACGCRPNTVLSPALKMSLSRTETTAPWKTCCFPIVESL